MAIELKQRQALDFKKKPACFCAGDYCQPVQQGDDIFLQGNVSVSTGLNLVQDPSFLTDVAGPGATFAWDLDANWDISSGVLASTNATPLQTVNSVNPLGLRQGQIYLIQTSVNWVSGGGWRVSVNGQYLKLPGTTLGQFCAADVTGSWLFVAGAITTDVVLFESNTGTFQVAYFNIYEMSMPGVALYDNDNVLIVDDDDLDGENTITYTVDGSTFSANTLQIETTEVNAFTIELLFTIAILDFTDITSETGCMTMRVYDTVMLTNRVRNGAFTTDLSYWTAGTHWSWVGGKADYAGDGLSAGTLCQTLFLIGGYEYTFSYTQGGTGLNGTIKVLINIDGQGTETLGVFAGNGPQSATIDLSAYSGFITVEICFAEDDGPNKDLTFTVDGVSVVASEPDPLNTSNCINVQETHNCTLYFEADNDDNAFGFEYVGTGMMQAIRLYSKLKLLGLREDKELFEFSDNSSTIMFAKGWREYEARIGDASNHVHECLQIMRLHDTFEVSQLLSDGSTETNEMIPTGDYDIKTRDRKDGMATATFPVKEKQGVSSNYSCS